MIRFVRVHFNQGRRPVYVKVTSEGSGWICGWRVNSNGDEVAGKGHARIQEVIEKSAIAEVREYRENRKYGGLEPANG